MLVHGSGDNLIIVRLTPGGKAFYYRGNFDGPLLSDMWTTNRKLAIRYSNDQRLEVIAANVGRKMTDRIVVIPDDLVDAVVKIDYEEQAERRRRHRLNRQVSRTKVTPAREGFAPTTLIGRI